LKVLNLPNLAEAHIYKSLVKLKAISHCPAFSQCVSVTRKASQTRLIEQDIIVNNVTARLYNSNPVKAAMAGILEAVRIALGLENVGGGGDQKAQKRRKGDEARALSTGHFALSSEVETRGASPLVGLEVDGRNRSLSSKATDIFRPEDGQEDPRISKYDNRIAENERDGKRIQQGREALLKAYNPEVDRSLSSPPSEGSSSDPPTLKPQKRKKPPTPPKSTFLPSLMGGYWSGSESAEDKSADLQPKKNRMGQRARRQLWEKKFGAKANHLKKAARDKDWDPKKGAKVDDRGGTRPAGESFRGTNTTAKYSRTKGKPGEGRGSGKSSSSMKKADEGPLHPSWEAAKKAKQQAMQTTFKGKKIVFD
jgi:BUD22